AHLLHEDGLRPARNKGGGASCLPEIELGTFTKSQSKVQKLQKALTELKKMPYHYISIPNLSSSSFDEIVFKIKRWIKNYVGLLGGKAKDCLVILDYLKLTDISLLRDAREYQVLGYYMTTLHNMATKYNFPILVFVQLNRDGISEEETSVVAGSDRIIWLCSNFSIYRRKTIEEIAEQPVQFRNYNMKLINLISRHGPGMNAGDFLNIYFNSQICKIYPGKLNSQMNLDEQYPEF
ncbi:MAG: DnaB-like helicase C-terminal domain-containing protein, partial [Bacteroidales bacterium]